VTARISAALSWSDKASDNSGMRSGSREASLSYTPRVCSLRSFVLGVGFALDAAVGASFELNAIAAAVLGGTSMSGGRGTIGGTIIGAFVIGILSGGLVMMGVSEFWQMVIKGVVIIAAVVVDQAQRKLQQRVALQQMAQFA
jgi:hypothetical protein